MQTDPGQPARFRIGDLILDSGTFQISREGEVIELPRLSFQLLLALAQAAPNVLSHDELVEAVWSGRIVSNETVTQRIKLLRQSLDDSATQPRYIGLVRGEGYRLLADVERLPAEEPAATTALRLPTRHRQQVLMAVPALVLAVMILLAYQLLYDGNRDGARSGPAVEGDWQPAANTVAVLPFANASEIPGDLYISEGLGDELRDQLSVYPGLHIAARSSSISFRDQAVAVTEISRRLGVGQLVEGSFRRDGDQLKISVQIIDGLTGFQDWSRTYSLTEAQLLEVQQTIAEEVSRQLAAADNDTPAVSPPVTRNVTAHELLLLARHYEQQVRAKAIVDRDLLLKAIDFYRQATEADPDSALAHSHLGGALLYLGDVEAAKTPVFEALRLDPELSDVQYTMGLYYWKRVLPGSGAAFERAIQLNPNNVDALTAYAIWRWHQAEAVTPEKFFRRAIELDPMSPSRYMDLGNYYGAMGRRLEATQLAREIDSRFDESSSALILARIYELIGELDVAIAWALRALETQTDTSEPAWMLAELYARIGDYEQAARHEPDPGLGQLYWQRRYEELIELAENLIFEHPGEIKTWYALARAYSATGRFDRAVSILQRAGLPETVYSDSRRADATEALVVLAEAEHQLGRLDQATEYALWLQNYFQDALENGFDKSWWPHVYLACVQAILGQDDEAMDRLAWVNTNAGLVWYPVLKDSACFKRFGNDPRYRSVVEIMDQRMAEIRRRLPDTLAEFAAARRNGSRPL